MNTDEIAVLAAADFEDIVGRGGSGSTHAKSRRAYNRRAKAGTLPKGQAARAGLQRQLRAAAAARAARKAGPGVQTRAQIRRMSAAKAAKLAARAAAARPNSRKPSRRPK